MHSKFYRKIICFLHRVLKQTVTPGVYVLGGVVIQPSILQSLAFFVWMDMVYAYVLVRIPPCIGLRSGERRITPECISV